VSGVLEDGDEQPIGTSRIITNHNGEEMAALTGGQGVLSSAKRRWPKLAPAVGRYVASLLIRTNGLPQSLPAESFIVPTRPGQYDPRRPTVHLQRVAKPANSVSGVVPDGELLVAELLLPARGPLTLLEAREAVLSTLRTCLPFFERHLIALDSPYDGLPLWLYGEGGRRDVDRIHVRETLPQGEPLDCQWSVEPRGYLDLAGEPLRGPIPGTYLVGSSVLPALGQEGEVVAALSVARIITQKGGGHQRMRQKMWSRIETS
jgi:hypothetical protein